MFATILLLSCGPGAPPELVVENKMPKFTVVNKVTPAVVVPVQPSDPRGVWSPVWDGRVWQPRWLKGGVATVQANPFTQGTIGQGMTVQYATESIPGIYQGVVTSVPIATPVQTPIAVTRTGYTLSGGTTTSDCPPGKP